MKGSRTSFDGTVSTTGALLLSSSSKRLAVRFFPPSSGQVTLSNDLTTTYGQGIVLKAGQTSLRLSYREDGDCVQREWYAIYAAGSTGIGIIEVFG
jgi:hypothetical protein